MCTDTVLFQTTTWYCHKQSITEVEHRVEDSLILYLAQPRDVHIDLLSSYR